MLRILTLNGSPVKNSSTGMLLEYVVKGIEQASNDPVENRVVNLNELKILPCQSCGESPAPDYCLFHDDINPLFDYLLNCDVVLFGSPIYFDTVSAQAKCFIDRCNCLRPPNFDDKSKEDFGKIITKERLGGIILVGGERGEFECARKVIAGFFKWVRIRNCGTISYINTDFGKAGGVKFDNEKLVEAITLGNNIVTSIPKV